MKLVLLSTANGEGGPPDPSLEASFSGLGPEPNCSVAIGGGGLGEGGALEESELLSLSRLRCCTCALVPLSLQTEVISLVFQ